jgi:hypothetical protein
MMKDAPNTETYDSNSGCWVGPKARLEANAVRDWLIKEYGFHEKAVSVQKVGGGTQTEWLIYFPALRSYFWPNDRTKEEFHETAERKAADYFKVA